MRSQQGCRAAFEADLGVRLVRAREFILPAHLTEFDAVLAHARDGRHGWTMLWRSLSPTQGCLMSALGDGNVLRILSPGQRPPALTGKGLATGVRASTDHAMAGRGLFDWTEPVLGGGS